MSHVFELLKGMSEPMIAIVLIVFGILYFLTKRKERVRNGNGSAQLAKTLNNIDKSLAVNAATSRAFREQVSKEHTAQTEAINKQSVTLATLPGEIGKEVGAAVRDAMR